MTMFPRSWSFIPSYAQDEIELRQSSNGGTCQTLLEVQRLSDEKSITYL